MDNGVLNQIVSSGKMPVLFIGSGISKRYLYKYPDWKTLLQDIFEFIEPGSMSFQKYYDEFSRQDCTEFEILTKIGSHAEEEFNRAFYDKKIDFKVGSSKQQKWVSQGVSPFKMYLSKRFKKHNIYHSAKTNEELIKFRQLREKVAAVITTNYDLFLEKKIFNENFSVFVNQSDLFSDDSYNVAEIYKIHGSARDANSIVITERDYNHFNETRKLIIAKMLILFSESPIIFMGYSFTDENIRNIIADFLGCLSSEQLSTIDSHFVFVSYEKDQMSLIESKTQIVTPSGDIIPVTEIRTDNYSLIFDTLNQIVPGISPLRIRQTRKVIKRIIDDSIASQEADSIIIGLDKLDHMDFSSKPIAVAVGYRENILNKYGYGQLAPDVIIEDLLYDNKDLDSEHMCYERYESIARNHIMPVFKYVSGLEKKGLSLTDGSHLQTYIDMHDSFEKIVPSNIAKQIKNVPIIDCYENLLTEISSVIGINKKAGVLLRNIQYFSVDQIRSVLKGLFRESRQDAMRSTHFKRCVLYLDWMENWQKGKSQ